MLLGGDEAEMGVLEGGGWVGMNGSSEADRVLRVSGFSARFAVRSDDHHSCPRGSETSVTGVATLRCPKSWPNGVLENLPSLVGEVVTSFVC